VAEVVGGLGEKFLLCNRTLQNLTDAYDSLTKNMTDIDRTKTQAVSSLTACRQLYDDKMTEFKLKAKTYDDKLMQLNNALTQLDFYNRTIQNLTDAYNSLIKNVTNMDRTKTQAASSLAVCRQLYDDKVTQLKLKTKTYDENLMQLDKALTQLDLYNRTIQNLTAYIFRLTSNYEANVTDLIDKRLRLVTSLKTCQKTYDDKVAQLRQVLIQRNTFLNHSIYHNNTMQELAFCRLELENQMLASKDLNATLVAAHSCKCEGSTLPDRIDAFENTLSKLNLPTTPLTPAPPTTTTTPTTPTSITDAESTHMPFRGTTEAGDTHFQRSEDDIFEFENATKVAPDDFGPSECKCLLTASLKTFLYLTGAFFLQSFTIIWLIICGCQKRLKTLKVLEAEQGRRSAKKVISKLERETLALRERIAQLEHVIQYESEKRALAARRQPTASDAAQALNFQV